MLNLRRFSPALIWLTLTSFDGAALAEPAASPKVVFVVVDGIPADVIERVPTPTIDAIAAEGGYGRATVGGPIGGPGETPTISAPGYMSLVTGTWANKHKVYKNYGISPDYRYWNLFRLARAEKPELQLAIFSTWTDNRTILLGADMPLQELVSAADKTQCEAIVLSGLVAPDRHTLEQGLPNLVKATGVPVFVGGKASTGASDALRRAEIEVLGTDISQGMNRLSERLPLDGSSRRTRA